MSKPVLYLPPFRRERVGGALDFDVRGSTERGEQAGCKGEVADSEKEAESAAPSRALLGWGSLEDCRQSPP